MPYITVSHLILEAIVSLHVRMWQIRPGGECLLCFFLHHSTINTTVLYSNVYYYSYIIVSQSTNTGPRQRYIVVEFLTLGSLNKLISTRITVRNVY